MKKILACLLTLTLLMIPVTTYASTPNANANVYVLNASTANDTLNLNTVISNIGNVDIYNISSVKVKVTDKNGALIVNSIIQDDKRLGTVHLAAGESIPWIFSFAGVKQADLSKYTYDFEIKGMNGKNVIAQGNHVFLNGTQLKSIAPQGQTFVSLRDVASVLGANLSQSQDKKNVDLLKKGSKITFTYGKEVKLVEGITYISINAIKNSFKGSVVAKGVTGSTYVTAIYVK